MRESLCSGKKLDAQSADLLRKAIEEKLEKVTTLEREVLEYRFGLKDGIPKTQKEVAKKFAIAQEWVGEIEVSFLRKLREPKVPRSRELRDFCT